MTQYLRALGRWFCPNWRRRTPVSRGRSGDASPITPLNDSGAGVASSQVAQQDYQSISVDRPINVSNNSVFHSLAYQSVTVNIDGSPASSDYQSKKPVNKPQPVRTERSVDRSRSQSSDEERPLTPLSAEALVSLKRSMSNYSSSINRSRDITAYISHYPGQRDDLSLNENLQFHRNKLVSKPDGGFIEDIHRNWWGDYSRLEQHHGYIQWLFPIREPGMNYLQHPLQVHEINAIRADPQCWKRLIQSYRLMLDFYGFELVDEHTGRLKRSPKYKERMGNLIHMSHNYLRITRILKCLGELGFEHLKLGFCLMLWTAVRVKSGETMRRSAVDFWFKTLRDQNDRDLLDAVIKGEKEMASWADYRDLLTHAAETRKRTSEESDENMDAAPHSGRRRSLPEDDDADTTTKPVKRARVETADVEDAKADDEDVKTDVKDVTTDVTTHEMADDVSANSQSSKRASQNVSKKWSDIVKTDDSTGRDEL